MKHGKVRNTTIKHIKHEKQTWGSKHGKINTGKVNKIKTTNNTKQ